MISQHHLDDDVLMRRVRTAITQALNGQRDEAVQGFERWLQHQRTMPRLLGAGGAAKLLGIQVPHLARLRAQNRMPVPVYVEGGNDVYVYEEVEALAFELARERADRRARKAAS